MTSHASRRTAHQGGLRVLYGIFTQNSISKQREQSQPLKYAPANFISDFISDFKGYSKIIDNFASFPKLKKN